MTSDVALEFSSCNINIPTIGLCRFQGTLGLDLVRVFYITASLQVIKSTLAPYSYPGFATYGQEVDVSQMIREERQSWQAAMRQCH